MILTKLSVLDKGKKAKIAQLKTFFFKRLFPIFKTFPTFACKPNSQLLGSKLNFFNY